MQLVPRTAKRRKKKTAAVTSGCTVLVERLLVLQVAHSS